MTTSGRNSHRLTWLALCGALLILTGGCAAHHAYLVPTPADNLTNGGQAAMASADNISITVTPNAWQGTPHDLYRRVTPLKVRIENHSKEPIRLTYGDFALETPQGTMLAALPPSEIRGTQYIGDNGVQVRPHFIEAALQDSDQDDRSDKDHRADREDHPEHGGTRVIITPGFDYDDFYYAPYWGYGYVGLGPWPYGWGADRGYYNMYYPYMERIHLPTRSMLTKAIPEGVIGPGGYVQGFLYFKKVDPDLKNVEFVAKLQHAQDGQQFGHINIPLGVVSK